MSYYQFMMKLLQVLSTLLLFHIFFHIHIIFLSTFVSNVLKYSTIPYDIRAKIAEMLTGNRSYTYQFSALVFVWMYLKSGWKTFIAHLKALVFIWKD
jgi:hypothetical protein